MLNWLRRNQTPTGSESNLTTRKLSSTRKTTSFSHSSKISTFLLRFILCFREKYETELRVKEVEIDEARKNQSTMLQQSLNMKSSHEESMSIAIDNIRDEHERDVKRLQKKMKVGFLLFVLIFN